MSVQPRIIDVNHVFVRMRTVQQLLMNTANANFKGQEAFLCLYWLTYSTTTKVCDSVILLLQGNGRCADSLCVSPAPGLAEWRRLPHLPACVRERPSRPVQR